MMNSTSSKYENNWRFKTLENLEKNIWAEPTYDSYLVKTCHRLRKKPINDFEGEDLRILIGQNIGLKYLIPLALEILDNDIFAEGDYCEGDLLRSVLTCDYKFWSRESEFFKKLENLISNNQTQLEHRGPKYLDHFNNLKRLVGKSEK